MIINNTYKFIFVHVPKAAGTSVTNVLSPLTRYCDLEIGGTDFGERIQPAYKKRFGLAKHSASSDIRAVVGSDVWDKYFKFSFVRNPYKRAVSTFNFLKGWDGCPPDMQERLKSYKTFEDYVLSDIWDETFGPDGIFRPQTFWLTDSSDRSAVIVDYVGRIEDIERDMKYVLEKIGVEVAFEMPKLNVSLKVQAELDLAPEVVDKINFYYKRDFNFFSYEMIKV